MGCQELSVEEEAIHGPVLSVSEFASHSSVAPTLPPCAPAPQEWRVISSDDAASLLRMYNACARWDGVWCGSTPVESLTSVAPPNNATTYLWDEHL